MSTLNMYKSYVHKQKLQGLKGFLSAIVLAHGQKITLHGKCFKVFSTYPVKICYYSQMDTIIIRIAGETLVHECIVKLFLNDVGFFSRAEFLEYLERLPNISRSSGWKTINLISFNELDTADIYFPIQKRKKITVLLD
jgi:hypothetical protein